MENGPYGNIYIIILSIVGTVVIMVISGMYTLRNIKRVWCLGSVKKKRAAAAAKTSSEKKESCNADRSNLRERKKDAGKSQQQQAENSEKEDCAAPGTTTTSTTEPSTKTTSENNGKQAELEESEGVAYESDDPRDLPDPIEYYHHIPSEVKKARQRVAIKNIKSQLTQEELEEEKAIQRKQLQEMFDLMKSQGDKFGLTDSEMEKQMQLYSI